MSSGVLLSVKTKALAYTALDPMRIRRDPINDNCRKAFAHCPLPGPQLSGTKGVCATTQQLLDLGPAVASPRPNKPAVSHACYARAATSRAFGVRAATCSGVRCRASRTFASAARSINKEAMSNRLVATARCSGAIPHEEISLRTEAVTSPKVRLEIEPGHTPLL